MRTHSTPRRPVRSAFTIIELMVVIVIIAILASFLLGAVQNAMLAARRAQVVADIKNLEQAIKNFNQQFGMDPPSGIVLFEDSAGWAGSTPANSALVKKMFPEFLGKAGAFWITPDHPGPTPNAAYPTGGGVDGAIDIDINGDGDAADVIALNGAEALAFFLGGVCRTEYKEVSVVDQNGVINPMLAGGPIDRRDSLGFSKNPSNPFARGGSRLGPFTALDPDRFIDRNLTEAMNDKMPEYLDPLSGQLQPYLYFSSYGGKGYRVDNDLSVPAPVPAGTDFDMALWAGCDFVNIYSSDPIQAVPLNPRSFQIISPGFDNELGNGGQYNGDGIVVPPMPQTDELDRAFEKDNITNFKNGTLN